MGSNTYILNGRETLLCADGMKWAKWFEGADLERCVGSTTLYAEDGEITVSTVFLGLDHNYSGGTPILFETMVFIHRPGIPTDTSLQWRYSDWESAEDAHAEILCHVLDILAGGDPKALLACSSGDFARDGKRRRLRG